MLLYIIIILSFLQLLKPINASLFPQNNGEIHCPLHLTLPLFVNDNYNYAYNPDALKTLHLPGKLSLTQVKQAYSVTNILAAILAIDHINTKNGEVIEELSSTEFQSCNLKIPTLSIIDENTTPIPKESNGDGTIGIDVSDGILYMPGFSADQINGTYFDEENHSYLPCVAIGPFSSKHTYDASFLMSRMDVPLISPFASIEYEDSAKDGRLMMSMGANIEVAVDSILSYLNERGRNYVAVIHENDHYSDQFASKLINRANDLNLAYISRAFSSSNGLENDLQTHMSEVKSLGFRTIVMILSSDTMSGSPTYVDIVKMAIEMNMDHSGNMWILHSSENSRYLEPFVHASSKSMISKYFEGVGLHRNDFTSSFANRTDMFEMNFRTNMDMILKVLQSHGFLESRMNGLSENILYEFHRKAIDMDGHSLAFGEGRVVYDSIVAAALGACNIDVVDSEAMNGANHFDATMNNAMFTGASGDILMNSTSRFRSTNTTEFSMTNVRLVSEGRGIVQLGIARTSDYINNYWYRIQDFIYKDGTVKPPQPLRFFENEFILSSKPMVAKILFLSLAAFLMIFLTWVVIFIRRNETLNTVKCCSPLYIYMICASGYLFMFCSINFGLQSWYENALFDCKLNFLTFHFAIALDTSVAFYKCRVISKSGGDKISTDFIAKRPIISHIATALVIISPLCFAIIRRPTRFYDIVTKVDENGYPLSIVHSCFESGGSSFRSFAFVCVSVQWVGMSAYSWVTTRHSLYFEAVNINRSYLFRIGVLTFTAIMFSAKQGFLEGNGKLQWNESKSSYSEVTAFIMESACIISPPLIFVLCPILKKCLSELSSRPASVVRQNSDSVNAISSLGSSSCYPM